MVVNTITTKYCTGMRACYRRGSGFSGTATSAPILTLVERLVGTISCLSWYLVNYQFNDYLHAKNRHLHESFIP